MCKMYKALMASTAVIFAPGLSFSTSAQDPSAAPGVVRSGEQIKLQLYGQIGRQFGWVGDGESTTFKQGENDKDGTPIGIGATFAGGRQWLKRGTTPAGVAKGDPLNINPAIHYTAKWTKFGETTIEYPFQYTEDITDAGDKG